MLAQDKATSPCVCHGTPLSFQSSKTFIGSIFCPSLRFLSDLFFPFPTTDQCWHPQRRGTVHPREVLDCSLMFSKNDGLIFDTWKLVGFFQRWRFRVLFLTPRSGKILFDTREMMDQFLTPRRVGGLLFDTREMTDQFLRPRRVDYYYYLVDYYLTHEKLLISFWHPEELVNYYLTHERWLISFWHPGELVDYYLIHERWRISFWHPEELVDYYLTHERWRINFWYLGEVVDYFFWLRGKLQGQSRETIM